MRYLIVSDIHSNLEALQAVLWQLEGRFDRIVCCGDIVGYGADPNAVTDWARTNLEAVVRGNHDKACTGSDDLEWFNPAARASAQWTLETLSPGNLEYLRDLPRGPLEVDGFLLVHGSPLDEDEYLVDPVDVWQITGYLEPGPYLFGHTHLQGGFLCGSGQARMIEPATARSAEDVFQVTDGVTHLINPGAVGQPRDRDARAACALYDSDSRQVTYCRVPYDIPSAQAKIRAAGLPEALAARLALGA